MKSKILAFDLGTSGNKASIYDEEGHLLGSSFVSYDTYYPRPGWHEQKPEDWWKAVVRSTGKLIQNYNIDIFTIKCLAISGHSMAVVPLDKNGQLLQGFVPIWSDTRAKKQADYFFKKTDYENWYQTTGNGFSRECYTLFKMIWYKDKKHEIYKKIDKVVGTKDYINYKLTGRILTDNSYASGSGVYDLKERKYKKDFIKASGLAEDIFPEIVASHDLVGKILPKVAEEIGLHEEIDVFAGGVDNSCMALGAGVIDEGKVYLSLGSSAWVAISSKEPIVDKNIKPFVFDHVVPNFYTSATSIFAAGSTFRWLKEEVLQIFKERSEKSGKDVYDLLVEEAMNSSIGANGIIFNPSLGGAPAAYPGKSIKGAFLGMELMHTQSDIIRAVLEGITMDLCLMYKKFEEICFLGDEVIIVGGGSKNPTWRQLFSDIFNKVFVKINTDRNTASLGAAAIAAVGSGLWESYDKINEIIFKTAISEPNMENARKYTILLKKYSAILADLSSIGRKMTNLSDD